MTDKIAEPIKSVLLVFAMEAEAQPFISAMGLTADSPPRQAFQDACRPTRSAIVPKCTNR
jgi:hypothetical protein